MTFRQKDISFVDGFYICRDEFGNNSIISHQCARWMEEDENSYQEIMEYSHSGIRRGSIFGGSGFGWNGLLSRYKVDTLTQNKQVLPIEGKFIIPQKVGDFEINCIHKKAFIGCEKLEHVVIPDTIAFIDDYAFEGCCNLTKVEILANDIKIGNNIYKGTPLDSDEVQYIETTLTRVNKDYTGVFTVRDGTTAIGENAFRDCQHITQVLLPDTVVKIGQGAFYGCTKLDDIVIPEGVEIIENYTFEKCVNLRNIKLPDSIICIHIYAFVNTGLFDDFLKSNENELYIGKWLINYRGEELILKPGTVGIANYSYLKSLAKGKLKTVEFPDSLKYIGNEAFAECKIKNIVLPSGLQSIGSDTFRYSEIESIVIPEEVQMISNNTFMGCIQLKDVMIYGKETAIEKWALDITNNQNTITVYAPAGSQAEKYCEKYGTEYNLLFKNI